MTSPSEIELNPATSPPPQDTDSVPQLEETSLPGVPQEIRPADDPSLCPRCGNQLVSPETIGWCSKCGYCRSLGSEGKKVPKLTDQALVARPSPLGVVEFCQLLRKLPDWLWVLLGGMAALCLISAVGGYTLINHPFAQALWSTLQLCLGLVLLLAAQFWALILIAPHDDKLSAKDLLLPGRLWGLTLQRLPATKGQVWLGGWSATAMAAAVFLIGGLSYWTQFYKPKKVANKNLLSAVAEMDQQGDDKKSLAEAVEDFAAKQDLTKDKKDKEKDKNKPDRRPVEQCVIIGYTVTADDQIESVLLATVVDEKLKYVGRVKRGFTEEVNGELRPLLKRHETDQPAIRGVGITAIWVKPAVFCEVHQSGYDEQSHLRDANFAGLLKN